MGLWVGSGSQTCRPGLGSGPQGHGPRSDLNPQGPKIGGPRPLKLGSGRVGSRPLGSKTHAHP